MAAHFFPTSPWTNNPKRVENHESNHHPIRIPPFLRGLIRQSPSCRGCSQGRRLHRHLRLRRRGQHTHLWETSTTTFLEAWWALCWLHPGLHPDDCEDWSDPTRREFAAEAFRRAATRGIRDDEFYPAEATHNRLCRGPRRRSVTTCFARRAPHPFPHANPSARHAQAQDAATPAAMKSVGFMAAPAKGRENTGCRKDRSIHFFTYRSKWRISTAIGQGISVAETDPAFPFPSGSCRKIGRAGRPIDIDFPSGDRR